MYFYKKYLHIYNNNNMYLFSDLLIQMNTNSVYKWTHKEVLKVHMLYISVRGPK